MLRTALVTGANRGIGLEVCRQLARQGLQVVLAARDAAAGDAAAAALRGQGLPARAAVLDVAREDSVRACAASLRQQGLHVDVLVNNAGVLPQCSILESREEDWQEATGVNLLGAVRTCRAFVPAMVQAGYGRVVNVSSGYGSLAEGLEGPAPYAVTKLALNGVTVKLAQEVRGDVKVNSVCPGWVRTRMGGPEAARSVEEGAATVVWLATLPSEGPSGGFFRDRQPVGW